MGCQGHLNDDGLQSIHTCVKGGSKTVFPLPAEPLARGPWAVPFARMADGVLLSW